MRRAFLPIVGILLGACAAPDAPEAFSVRDSAGIALAINGPVDSLDRCPVDSVATVRIGAAEDSDDYFLYRVMGASRLSDGRIAVVNQGTQEVRWFGPDGRLVGRAGRAGQGPGEFSDAFLMYPTRGDTLWVGDYSPWQWHIFDAEMRFVRSVRTAPNEINSPDAVAVFADGQQVMAFESIAQRVAFALDSMTLRRYGADGGMRDTVLQLPHERLGQMNDDPGSVWLRPWFDPIAQVEGLGDRLVVSTWADPELRVYRAGEQLSLERIIRWRTGDRRVTAAAVDSAREQLRHQYPDLSPEMRARLLDPMLHPDRPVAEQYAAVTGILVGRDGRVWAREFRAPSPTQRSWIGFAADGRAECRALLPAQQVAEIGADYVLTTERDSLGVETVAEYRLASPPSR